MKVRVLVDVANFQPRAWLTKDSVDVPTDELNRIIHFESGGEMPSIENINIYDILSKKQQNKIDKIASPISCSGVRGTCYVEVSEKN